MSQPFSALRRQRANQGYCKKYLCSINIDTTNRTIPAKDNICTVSMFTCWLSSSLGGPLKAMARLRAGGGGGGGRGGGRQRKRERERERERKNRKSLLTCLFLNLLNDLNHRTINAQMIGIINRSIRCQTVRFALQCLTVRFALQCQTVQCAQQAAALTARTCLCRTTSEGATSMDR